MTAVGSSVAIYATADLVNWSCIYRIQKVTSIGLTSMLWFNDAIHVETETLNLAIRNVTIDDVSSWKSPFIPFM